MSAAASILVVDDHDDSRLVLRAMLEHRGHRVLEAENGVVGLALARERRPDVIVLDLFMPQLDGWRTAEALKADAATASIPILALTASAIPEDHRRALAAGCRQVLVKPVPPTMAADVIASLHAEHLALVEANAQARRAFLTVRERSVRAKSECEAAMAAAAESRASSAEQRARSAQASAAAAHLLGGSHPPPDPQPPGPR